MARQAIWDSEVRMKGMKMTEHRSRPVRVFEFDQAVLSLKLLICTLTFLLMITMQLNCSQRSDGIPTALLETIDRFYATVEAGDHETRIDLFSPNAILMPNHWTMTQGKEAIAEIFRSGEGYIFKIKDREIVDMNASQNLAYTVNSYCYTYHAKGDDPKWHKTKNVHIWKKDDKGNWKLHVDIWNSDVSISEFHNE
jgi:ketosteroid isomerase-like protein